MEIERVLRDKGGIIWFFFFSLPILWTKGEQNFFQHYENTIIIIVQCKFRLTRKSARPNSLDKTARSFRVGEVNIAKKKKKKSSTDFYLFHSNVRFHDNTFVVGLLRVIVTEGSSGQRYRFDWARFSVETQNIGSPIYIAEIHRNKEEKIYRLMVKVYYAAWINCNQVILNSFLIKIWK